MTKSDAKFLNNIRRKGHEDKSGDQPFAVADFARRIRRDISTCVKLTRGSGDHRRIKSPTGALNQH